MSTAGPRWLNACGSRDPLDYRTVTPPGDYPARK